MNLDREQMLRSRGFVMSRRRMLWLNRELRMAFSHETIQDAETQRFQHALSERVPPTDFVFHFSRSPEDLQVCTEILAEIGLSNLVPQVRLATIAVTA
jgi:hypothetical protein